MLTQKKLKELLYYNPDTGIFRWNISKPGVRKGSIAGSINPNGYRYITINRKKYSASRIAFFLMEGFWPKYEIDHINRKKSDDRWKNLRHVPHVCNAKNRGIHKNNKSGVTGVSWNTLTNNWYASIMVNGNTKNLGYYNDFDEAVLARLAAEQHFGWNECNPNSTAYKYVVNHELAGGVSLAL